MRSGYGSLLVGTRQLARQPGVTPFEIDRGRDSRLLKGGFGSLGQVVFGVRHAPCDGYDGEDGPAEQQQPYESGSVRGHGSSREVDESVFAFRATRSSPRRALGARTGGAGESEFVKQPAENVDVCWVYAELMRPRTGSAPGIRVGGGP